MDDIFSPYGITLQKNQFYKLTGHWTTQINKSQQKSQIFNKIKESNHAFLNKIFIFIYHQMCSIFEIVPHTLSIEITI